MKNLSADGDTVQIYISWRGAEMIETRYYQWAMLAVPGIQLLGSALCAEIDKLKNDSDK